VPETDPPPPPPAAAAAAEDVLDIEAPLARDLVVLTPLSSAKLDCLEDDSLDNFVIAVIREPDVEADVGRCTRGGEDVVNPFLRLRN
jgi:hypothetical protein